MELGNQFSQHGNISISSFSNAKAAILLSSGHNIPINKMQPPTISTLPNKIPNDAVNVITNSLRHPHSLHVINSHAGQNSFSKSHFPNFIQELTLLTTQSELNLFNQEIKIFFLGSAME